MSEREHKVDQKEGVNSNKVFYLERDFYSNPQVVVVVAGDKEEANTILNKQLSEENYPPGNFGELVELDTSKKGLQVINPPGDRHMVR